MVDIKPDFKSSLISSLNVPGMGKINYFSLTKLEAMGFNISKLPFSIRIVLESIVRNAGNNEITEEDVKALAQWNPKTQSEREIPFKVSRILMQDFTGVPAVVDLAAMRDYVSKMGYGPEIIQPTIPVDLVIDHSVQVDAFNVVQALDINQEKEISRNRERYQLLKWASKSFDRFRVLPPSAGICHQVNLEYLATCVSIVKINGEPYAIPDTLVGTDSHTTMINGLGVVGFGVGGIEAEAALLDQPIGLATPRVLGVRLTGKLKSGVTATDFALTLTRKLREKGVVGMFVEFFGPGLDSLSLPDRATLSNMCPEYGATIAIFPIDNETLRYMEMTGRKKEQIDLIRSYFEAQNMLPIDYSNVEYSDIMEVALEDIAPCVSGPSQPKQEMPLSAISTNFKDTFLQAPEDKTNGSKISSADYTRWSEESMSAENGSIKSKPTHRTPSSVHLKYDDGYETDLNDGDVVISSITSCTNTSNPSVMLAAGILAKKAIEHGLSVNTRKVKTSLGPGSRVVMKYLEAAGLYDPLKTLGYGLVGYGCITCIGNSGPLIEKQSEAINSNNMSVAAVLSGNRNYEARIHRDVRANYLMSPPLLVAFGIAGTVLKDLTKEPVGKNNKGEDVYLNEIWPTQDEINKAMKAVSKKLYEDEYSKSFDDVNPYWRQLSGSSGLKYAWDTNSTYIRSPPFFESDTKGVKQAAKTALNARVLAILGDSISTDHISPAGAIGKGSPAGKYLQEHGVKPEDFNTYGSRRGNHEVMMRGTFANNRIKNLMVPGREGGFTIHYPSGEEMTIYDAAMKYYENGTPLIVIAGIEYGSGSSRDWAAKGPALLGVKAVVARSFERIHRSNLVGMGILPLQFVQGESSQTLKLDPSKEVTIEIGEELNPRSKAKMTFTTTDGNTSSATLSVRIDNAVELEYYKAGGILNYVVKKRVRK